MNYGIDEAWQRLSPAEVKAAGKTFVIGYVSEDTTGKNIARAEIDAYHAAGLDVLLVYEYKPKAYLDGAPRGRKDAGIAVDRAKALEYPSGCTIAFAIDADTSGNPSVIADYCRAFTEEVHSAGYRTMVYGGLSTIRYCMATKLADYFWQTYAWSNGIWENGVTIRQYQNGVKINNKDVDFDMAMVPEFGQWKASGNVPPPPVPTPVPTPGESDFAMTHWTTVKFGSSGDLVKVAQGILIAHGLPVGANSPDGQFGPVTRSSTILLQRRYGIKQDGEFGPHTLSVGLYGKDFA